MWRPRLLKALEWVAAQVAADPERVPTLWEVDGRLEHRGVTIKGRIDRLRDDPSSLPEVARDVANKPEVRQAAAQAAEGARQASWWTLAGMIISMMTVILGSLVGAGEMLQPVPILGVRRVTPPRS